MFDNPNDTILSMLDWIVIIGTPLGMILLWWAAFRSALKNPNRSNPGPIITSYTAGGSGH
jgi:hypothetical protein